MAAVLPDALDALRAALAKAGGSSSGDTLPAAGIALLDADGNGVEDVLSAQSIQIGTTTYPKTHTTRLARSRNVPSLAADATGTPETAAEDFFALDAIIFAVQMASAQGGVYVVQATNKGLSRFDAVERSDLLAYLFGKRAEWGGVLSIEDTLARQAGTSDSAAGPSTTPPSSPPLALKQLYGAASRIPTKRAYVPSKTDAAFVKRLRTSGVEIVLQNRNDAMHGSHPWTKTADFSTFRLALAPTIDAARKLAGAKGSSAAATTAQRSATSASAPAQRRRAQEPILMLSNSPTALINMFNVKRLLEEGVFVDPYEARNAAGGVAESVVVVNHRVAHPAAASAQTASSAASNVRSTGRFLVVDNADSLQKLAGAAVGGQQDVWNRVVAVFTTGQVWQFKQYHWSEPRELFKHVMGVYVRWHNEPKNQNVRDWPIMELAVDRTKRHTDRQVVAHFWRSVDGFIVRRKTNLIM